MVIALIEIGDQLLQGLLAFAGVLIPERDLLALGVEGFAIGLLLLYCFLLLRSEDELLLESLYRKLWAFESFRLRPVEFT